MDLSSLCDEYWALREARLAKDKEAEELKVKEKEAESQILDYMVKNNLSALGGKTIKLELKKTDEPSVCEWKEVWDYVREEDAWDLLYRRINAAAVKERLKQGVSVPGIEWFPVFKLSKSKVKPNGN